jgi:hypothetical protein
MAIKDEDPFRLRSHAKAPQVLVIAFLCGVGLFAAGRSVWNSFRAPTPELPLTQTAAAPITAPRPASVHVASHASASEANSIAKFHEKVGAELRVGLTREGRLESARGAPGTGARAGADFTPDDPQKAIARAREVLAAAREAMGVDDELPLGMPIAKASATSAQVFFHETLEGVPLAPVGTVSVDLGPQGELLGLSSDYLPGVRVVNARTHTADELLKSAATAVPGVTSALKPSGGSPIIWVAQNSAGAVEGRHAYEYQVQGHQVIVDASTGEILRKRDHRDF